MEQVKQSIAHKPNNLDQYYEYRVYDKNIGNSSNREMFSCISEYAPCPVVVMSRHQGFQWNEELFVNAYRRSAGYECHKSQSLKNTDQKITHSTNQQQQSSDDTTVAEVIDINLTEEDRDVWP
jgi:hypothetical protein